MTFIGTVKSDMRAYYPEDHGLSLLFRCLVSPPFRASLLVRACQFSPKSLFWLFRNLLITLHSIDFGRGAIIGEGLRMPHPVGIVIGAGVVAGRNLTIYQGVTLGISRGKYPTIHDNVSIYPNAVVVGAAHIENGRKIRALTWIHAGDTKDVVS